MGRDDWRPASPAQRGRHWNASVCRQAQALGLVKGYIPACLGASLMPFTVQLDLDAHAEAALGAVADRVAKISDLETMRQLGDVHHMSLGVYGGLAVDFFVPQLARFAETLR